MVDTHGNVVADETPDPRVGIDGRYFEYGRSYHRVLQQIHATEIYLYYIYVYHRQGPNKKMKITFFNIHDENNIFQEHFPQLSFSSYSSFSSPDYVITQINVLSTRRVPVEQEIINVYDVFEI